MSVVARVPALCFEQLKHPDTHHAVRSPSSHAYAFAGETVTHDRIGRLVALAAATLVLALAACGGSSNSVGPRMPTPAQLAAYFDSIYSANIAAGTPDGSHYAYDVADFLEATPAYGGQRATFMVTTAAGSQMWYGFTYEYKNVGGDSGLETIAYSDNSLTSIVAIGVNYRNDNADTNLYADFYQNRFSTRIHDSTVSYASAVVSVGAACSLETGLAADSVLAEYNAGYTCTNGTFLITASTVFPADAGLGALQSWSISAVTFDGPIYPELGAGRVPGAPSRIAAALARLHARLHPDAAAR